jgi:hypothetical protein
MATILKQKTERKARATAKVSASIAETVTAHGDDRAVNDRLDNVSVDILRIMTKRGRHPAEQEHIDSLSDADFLRELRAEIAKRDAAEKKIKTKYRHSAAWYAKQAAKDQAAAKRRPRRSLTEELLEMAQESRKDWEYSRSGDTGPLFGNPFVVMLALPVCLAADLGYAIFHAGQEIADPVKREKKCRALKRELRAVQRPLYYARETERRHKLARERKKIHLRATTSPRPTPEQVLEAWRRRKESKEAMIRLGGMLHDLECFVDNRLRFNENGEVVGRNGGIRGWLRDNLPELYGRYKTLMRYKAMAIHLRQATETKDPTPTDAVLSPSHPQHAYVKGLLENFRNSFSFLEEEIAKRLDPDKIFEEELDADEREKAEKRQKAERGKTEKHEKAKRHEKIKTKEQNRSKKQNENYLRKKLRAAKSGILKRIGKHVADEKEIAVDKEIVDET